MRPAAISTIIYVAVLLKMLLLSVLRETHSCFYSGCVIIFMQGILCKVSSVTRLCIQSFVVCFSKLEFHSVCISFRVY